MEDSSVRPGNPEDAVRPAAYLLFYRRRTEMSLGGDTAKLIEQYQARPIKDKEETDSTSTSPNNDAPTRSASSSPPPLVKSIGPVNVLSLYSPLIRNESSSPPLPSPSTLTWRGGWSNRAVSDSRRPTSLGFTYGNQPSAEDSSPSFESVDVTPNDADVESGNDDEEIEVVELEHVPVNMTDSMDDVQVIQLDSADGDERQGA
jgi:hypothetical protein